MTPFATGSNTAIASLPAQMIPKSKKTIEWKKATMDRLEAIGKAQCMENLRLVENYEMVKGKFIFHHYFEMDGYDDMLAQLTREFEIPKYLRHYDIISPIINTLSGEYQKRPDIFRVRGYDEETTNAYLRQKTRLLHENIAQEIDAEINMQLAQQGVDVGKSDFSSPQEQQQYEQQIAQMKQAMTPPQIQKYMDTEWMAVPEIWGQKQLELDKQKYNLPIKEKMEFEDMLISSRCFRHFYLTSDGFEQETWNPVNTFFHKSPEIENAEEGDYIGRIIWLSPSAIINRYGYRMSAKDIQALENLDEWNTPTKSKEKTKGFLTNGGQDAYGVTYGSMMPFAGFPDALNIYNAFGFDPLNPFPEIDLNSVFRPNYYVNTTGLLQVTESYWMSQRKVGKLIFEDPETGLPIKGLVDEDFIIPDFIKEVDPEDDDSDSMNTIIWTWVNEVYEGVKINKLRTALENDVYIGMKPSRIQLKGDSNLYGNRLPVVGQIFNNRNSDPMSVVDLGKPHQIGHNVAMNQLYQIMEREVGRFIIFDTNILPNLKDWGGEKGWEKFMLVAKSLGGAPVDTSPANTNGANIGNQFPKDIDLDESARMLSRAKLAEFFEQRALAQVGITPQRLGDVAASETATGVRQATTQSFAQTESWFTLFSDYKRRCLQMDLDFAQFVQSKNDNVTITYTKSDLSRSFMRLNGTQLLLADLHVYVSDSQENLRQLEMLRQLFLENNTTGATPVDLAYVVTSNSPQEIKRQIQESFNQQQEKFQQEQQLEREKIAAEVQSHRDDLEFEATQNQLDREAKHEDEYIRTFQRQPDNLEDSDGDNIPDVLEYDKLSAKIGVDREKLNLQRQKQVFEQAKAIADQRIRLKELGLKKEELDTWNKVENKKLKIAQITARSRNQNKPKPAAKKKKK